MFMYILRNSFWPSHKELTIRDINSAVLFVISRKLSADKANSFFQVWENSRFFCSTRNVSERGWEQAVTNAWPRFLGKYDDEFLYYKKIFFENLQHQAAMESPWQVCFIRCRPRFHRHIMKFMSTLTFLVFQSQEARLE